MYGYPTGADSNGQVLTFEKALGLPHQLFIKAQIEKPDGTVLADQLTVTDGEVSVDRTSAFRRSCSLSVAPTAQGVSVIPLATTDPLAPYGNLTRIFYGLTIPGLTQPYYWPLGLFRLSETNVQDEDGTPSISLQGFDLARTISRNQLAVPWIVGAGQNWGDAIIALASDRYPYIQARAHSVSATVPAPVVIDPAQDPWQVITDWATGVGCSVYFDVEGYLVITPEPDPATDPISWTYQDAGDRRNAVFLGASRTLTDEPGYNGVILTAESTTLPAPLRSEVWDLNPSSATYSLGAYGKVPKFVTNPYVATQAQADAAATAEFLRVVGGTERVSASVVPNPAHEAGDVVRLVRAASGINQTTILEGFTIPFAADEAMALTLRERRTT